MAGLRSMALALVTALAAAHPTARGATPDARPNPAALEIPFGVERGAALAWARDRGLRLDLTLKESPGRLVFDGCLWDLPTCASTRLSFSQGLLSSLSMVISDPALASDPLASFRRVKAVLTSRMGDPWFDRERVYTTSALSIAQLRASGQALTTSWTDFKLSVELRLDAGSTEGNLLRVVVRPYGKSGAPPTLQAIESTIILDNSGDSTLVKLALERAADRLRAEQDKLRPLVQRLGRAPQANLLVDAAALPGLAQVTRDFVAARVEQSIGRTSLVSFRGGAPELDVHVRFERRGKTRLIVLWIVSRDDGRELWRAAVDLDEG